MRSLMEQMVVSFVSDTLAWVSLKIFDIFSSHAFIEKLLFVLVLFLLRDSINNSNILDKKEKTREKKKKYVAWRFFI